MLLIEYIAALDALGISSQH